MLSATHSTVAPDVLTGLTLQRDAGSVPLYTQIADAMAGNILQGCVAAGARLPPQRDVAQRLKVNINTVSRAYSELQVRGLVTSGIGRGTYVQADRADGAARGGVAEIDLTMSRPAVPDPLQALARSLQRLPANSAFEGLQDYAPAEGASWARRAGTRWLTWSGVTASPNNVVVTSGAQHGLFSVLSAVSRPGDVIASASVTMNGMVALARLLNLQIAGLASDSQGVIPAEFEKLCERERVAALFVIPNLDNPTTITMPIERRKAMAEIARKHGVAIAEDDVAGLLLEERPTPIAQLYPERTFFISSTSKTLAPGLRIGFVRVPDGQVHGVAAGVAATCWSVSPIAALVASQWIEDGTAQRIIAKLRTELEARQSLAREQLQGFDISNALVSNHLWLRLPPPWRADEFTAQLRRAGVGVLPAQAFTVDRCPPPHAVRIHVGAARSREQLVRALDIIAAVLRGRPQTVYSIA